MGLFYGKVLSNILGDVYLIKLGIYVGTDLVFLDGFFGSSNDGKLEGLLLGR